MKLITALFVGALVIAGSAFAQDFDPPEQIEANAPPLHRFVRTLLWPDGLSRLLDHPQTRSECNSLLMATEQRLGRELTEEEVKRLLPTIRRAIEETLAQTSPGRATAQLQQGLATNTNVLTADGPVDIELVKPGTQIISYDLERGLTVTNKVVRLHRGKALWILGVKPIVTGFGPKYVFSGADPHIVVSRELPFFMPFVSAFLPLSRIVKDRELLFFRQIYGINKPIPIPSINSSNLPLETPIFQLELEGEPHNFFAAGLLVQSHIKKAGGK